MAALSFSIGLLICIFNTVFIGYVWFTELLPEDLVFLGSSFVLLLSFYALCRIYLLKGLSAEEELKKRSWLLGFVAAFLLSICSIPVTVDIFFREGGDYFAKIVSTNSFYSMQALIFFSVELLLDLIVGLFEYPEKMGIMSAWLHHTLFLMGGYVTLNYHSCGYFLAGALVEIPTFLFALGTLYAPLRTDLLFGISCFVFRVAFATWFTVKVWLHHPHAAVFAGMMVPALALNYTWFYLWARNYVVCGKKDSSSSKNDSESDRKELKKMRSE